MKKVFVSLCSSMLFCTAHGESYVNSSRHTAEQVIIFPKCREFCHNKPIGPNHEIGNDEKCYSECVSCFARALESSSDEGHGGIFRWNDNGCVDKFTHYFRKPPTPSYFANNKLTSALQLLTTVDEIQKSTNPEMIAAFAHWVKQAPASLINSTDTDKYGNTALIFACYNENLAVAKALLDAGADPKQPNRGNMTPLKDAEHKPALKALFEQHLKQEKIHESPLPVQATMEIKDATGKKHHLIRPTPVTIP